MITYIVRRLLFGIVVIFLVTVIIFYLIQLLPGDPARLALGDVATREQVEALRHELWLDRPLPVQYGHWLLNTIRGDLGNLDRLSRASVKNGCLSSADHSAPGCLRFRHIHHSGCDGRYNLCRQARRGP